METKEYYIAAILELDVFIVLATPLDANVGGIGTRAHSLIRDFACHAYCRSEQDTL